MRASYKKWCPNGCGTSAIRDVPNNLKPKKPYYCKRCNKRFTKKQIEKYN